MRLVMGQSRPAMRPSGGPGPVGQGGCRGAGLVRLFGPLVGVGALVQQLTNC